MRRVAWSILTGLGVFFIVLALLLRFFVPGQTVKFPLNEYRIYVLEGSNISYFSLAKLEELSAVSMRATWTISGDVAAAQAAGKNIAVWKSFIAIKDLTDNAPVRYSQWLLPFDRNTGVLVNCCGYYVTSTDDDNNAIEHPRLSGQGYVWPIGTKAQTYQVFDSTLDQPVAYHYTGNEVINGVSTYRFVAQIPSTQIGTQLVPGSFVGMTAAQVTLPEFYSATKTVWVDPVTGSPIKLDFNEKTTLQDSSGATRLVIFQGDLASTPGNISTVAAADQSDALRIQLVEIILPISAGLIGLILLIAGLLLGRRRFDDYEYEEEEPTVRSPV
jgi:hypothetical protein